MEYNKALSVSDVKEFTHSEQRKVWRRVTDDGTLWMIYNDPIFLPNHIVPCQVLAIEICNDVVRFLSPQSDRSIPEYVELDVKSITSIRKFSSHLDMILYNDPEIWGVGIEWCSRYRVTFMLEGKEYNTLFSMPDNIMGKLVERFNYLPVIQKYLTELML